MKAFLMYRDRDFDPQQLLARRDKELRYHRANEQGLELRQVLPWNEQALRQDLGLDIVFNAMAFGDRFLFEVANVAVLSSLSDLDTIHYRQHVYADCLKNAQVVRAIHQIAIDAIEGERKNSWSFFARHPSGILHRAVDVLQMFVGGLKRLRRIADQHVEKFESEGFSKLLSMLQRELSDDYFDEIETHLNKLKFRSGVLISAHLGQGNKGKNYVLRRPHKDERSWLTRLLAEKPLAYSFQLHPRDDAGAQALAQLNDRGVNLVANALAQSTDHILSFFHMLRTELAFYIGCLNLHAQLAQMGEPMCFPVPAHAGERKLALSNLHDVSLALSMGKKIVGNDLKANHKDIVVITGANTGGKSTFLRSIGLAQLMTQAGMFVSAESFAAEVCDGIFTHYKREEDASMESGKLDEELSRMSEIVDNIKSNALVLFNESFGSTNEREGSEIASQIVSALLDRNVKVFFVTHLYHFAHTFFARRSATATFLRAERRPDGTRPFKLVEAEPLQTSYGADLYRAIFGGSGERRRTARGSDCLADNRAGAAARPPITDSEATDRRG
ncbi:MAG TPA: DNA mismatch repair protein MutS [Xanthobacteraceae bacterium]|nr:DNA mismatch repair protein MutS [Xanthobacteraceae bacterium]